MKFTHVFFAAILSLIFQTSTFALDASSDVKVTTILKSENSWNGEAITYPNGKAEITGIVVEIAPGAQTGWHLHPVASFGMLLQGELDVELKNGAVNHLKAGDAILEVVNTLHNGTNVGNVPVKLVVFYTGVAGQTLTIKEH